MAALVLTSENQIQRLNHILNTVKKHQTLDLTTLKTPPNPKAWNIVEIIAHLNIAYGKYVEKINDTLVKSADIEEEPNGFKTRRWQKFVIEGQRPKNGVRKMKMKTMKRFEPLLDKTELTGEKIDEVFDAFFELHNHLKQSILKSRNKDVTKIKVTSAIGPIVKFYLPEAFEFLLCHLERHMVQIDEIIG